MKLLMIAVYSFSCFYCCNGFAQTISNFRMVNSVFDQGGSLTASPNFRVWQSFGRAGFSCEGSSTSFSIANNFFGQTNTLADIEEIKHLPSEFKLDQNYPNPFNPSTTINFQIPVPCHVVLKLYDISGKETAILFDEYAEPGVFNKQIRIDNLTSGIYIYKLVAGNFTDTKKLMLLK